LFVRLVEHFFWFLFELFPVSSYKYYKHSLIPIAENII